MFEGKNEKEAREQILELVSEYCDRFHNQNKNIRKATVSLMRRGSMTMMRW